MKRLLEKQITNYMDNQGNRIIGSPSTNAASMVEFKGKNCTVTFGDRVQFFGVVTFRGDNSSIHIGDRSSFRGHSSLGNGCEIRMGNDIYTGSDLQMTVAEETNIILGDGLLIANHCRIRADDSHPIYDGITGRRINPSMSVSIGNQVWLGQEVFVMPGSEVGSGSIIGARSLVTKSNPVPENSLAVGVPAKTQRSNVVWVRKHLQYDEILEDIYPPFQHLSECPDSNRSTD